MQALQRAQNTNTEIRLRPTSSGQVDLQAVLADLATQSINELHIEAGERLNGAFISQGLVDEYLIYLAPTLLSSQRGLASLSPLTRLEDQLALRFHSIDTIGPDLRILARAR
jgi:diaminohydroxyphosphoribosylaminopyrimidine deaminase / 5-amino-6-(5-phosphoribosylamino)uracil reductase